MAVTDTYSSIGYREGGMAEGMSPAKTSLSNNFSLRNELMKAGFFPSLGMTSLQFCSVSRIQIPVHSVQGSSQKFQLEYVYSKLVDGSVFVWRGGGGGGGGGSHHIRSCDYHVTNFQY